jgi:hypothetical protein
VRPESLSQNEGMKHGYARVSSEDQSTSARITMPLQIDGAFISEWHPKYNEIEDDECECQALVGLVRTARGSISKETFRRIWKWKGAMRVIRYIKCDQ